LLKRESSDILGKGGTAKVALYSSLWQARKAFTMQQSQQHSHADMLGAYNPARRIASRDRERGIP